MSEAGEQNQRIMLYRRLLVKIREAKIEASGASSPIVALSGRAGCDSDESESALVGINDGVGD
jgi:hypothetical protein